MIAEQYRDTGWQLLTFVEAMEELNKGSFTLNMKYKGMVYVIGPFTTFEQLSEIVEDINELMWNTEFYIYY